MLTQTQLKQVLSENGLRPKKRLGQNFLIDKNIKDKIIRFAGIGSNDDVLEIGPGLGALTEGLIEKARLVVAIEKDKTLARVFNNIIPQRHNFTLLEQDILKLTNYELDLFISKKIKVIGNLPYYITTPILTHLLKFKKRIDSILVTVQKEVAERIVSGPNTKNYGSISLYLQYHAEPAIEMKIPKAAFYPKPEVDSCLLRLKIRESSPVSVKDEELLFRLIRAAFGQRRKTLASALKRVNPNIRAALDAAGIDPACRGETLTLADFAKLTIYVEPRM